MTISFVAVLVHSVKNCAGSEYNSIFNICIVANHGYEKSEKSIQFQVVPIPSRCNS